MLMAFAEDTRFDIVGLNYKDKAPAAAAGLWGVGNPYEAVGVDDAGRAGIDWGVYGVPETFVVGRDGTVLYKQIGPIITEDAANTLMAEIEKALSAKATTR